MNEVGYSNNFGLSRIKEFMSLKKNTTLRSSSLKIKRRKSIRIESSAGENSFNKGIHLFKISDLIAKFCEKRNHKAIK